jgi:hypothetical protein
MLHSLLQFSPEKMTFNRQELQDAYINNVIDGMDMDDCLALLFDFLDKDLDKYSDEELITEVNEYYPDLLKEDVTV